jgi:hypothetical protein
MGEDKQSIVSKVKTGLNSFKDLKLPIAEHSIAGYVALAKKTANIKDVYDENELRALNGNLRFLQEVDKRTGYRTKQMLVAPILESGSNELIGVIQIINNKAGIPFGALAEEGVSELSQTLAIAFKQRQKPQVAKTKYDYLIADAVLSAGEFELAARQARKKAIDIEQVLTDEFQVKIPAIGAALSKFFGVPYEAFKSDRVKPAELLKNLKREYVEANQWVPIDDAKEGLTVLCLDPSASAPRASRPTCSPRRASSTRSPRRRTSRRPSTSSTARRRVPRAATWATSRTCSARWATIRARCSRARRPTRSRPPPTTSW